MTLHSSKGLEFPVVCLVGMEQGLFPSYRSIDDPSSLEEERRLCYVGLTRAKEKLFLFHASERRMWGGMREPAIASIFLSEIPEELIKGDIPLSGGATLRREKNLDRLTRIDRQSNKKFFPREAENAVRKHILVLPQARHGQLTIECNILHLEKGKLHMFLVQEKKSHSL